MRTILLAFALTFAVSVANGATITQVSGTVSVKMSPSGPAQPATVGMNVPNSAIIVTGANGRARVDLGGGRSSMVQPNQQAAVSSLSTGGGGGALNRLGDDLSSSRVASVAGVRASNEGDTGTDNLWAVEMNNFVQGEDEAIAAADAAADAEDFEAAISGLQEFTSATPRAYRASLKLATMYRDLGDFDNAIPLYENLLEEMPQGIDVPSLMWNLVVCHQAAGNYTESDRVADDALSRYPSSQELAKIKLVKAYNAFYAGNVAEARARATDALTTAMTHVTELATVAGNGNLRANIRSRHDVQGLVEVQIGVWQEALALRSYLESTE